MRERALPGKTEAGRGGRRREADLAPVLRWAAARAGHPLSKVARLEEFSRRQLEALGDQPVIQYRGQILPAAAAVTVLVERRARPASRARARARCR
jgi:hypothetical protein